MVLPLKDSWRFATLFGAVHTRLRSLNRALSNEGLLRSRFNERLQKFIRGGMVVKRGREYWSVPDGALTIIPKTMK